MDNFRIRTATEADLPEVMKIMNSFAKNSFAVYSSDIIPESFAEVRFKDAHIFLVIQKEENIVGFGFIMPYNPFKNFSHTGVLSYFIYEEFTGMGLGTELLNELMKRGKESGITNYLAHISSKNNQSLSFHKKHGFEEAGRFKNVAIKFNEYVDVVWVQKQFENYGSQQ